VGRTRLLPRGREDAEVALVLALTLGTGTVDAVSYFSLDRVFTANMSGNMALLGIGVATGIRHVAGNLFAFTGFVLGSIAAGRFMRRRRGRHLRRAEAALWAQLTVLTLLTAVAAAVDLSTSTGWRYAVCALLAGAMGIQTAVARHLSVQDVNTTVATMTLHDLAASSRLAGGDSPRWRRRLGVVVALFAGAAVGVALDDLVRWGGLAFVCVVVLAVIAGLRLLGAAAPAREQCAAPVRRAPSTTNAGA
jgi:uncharacterized membrane protein YoaK (UPF0700 family)